MRKVLETFGVAHNERSVVSPLPHDAKLERWEGEVTDREVFDYMRFVGCMQWLSISTRPDLAHGTGVLARYTSNPGPAHVAAARHMMRYLCGTPDLGITYHGGRDVLKNGYDHMNKMIASADADLGGCLDTRKSTTGYVIMVNGGAIAWRAKRQTQVSLSTMQSELEAAASLGALIEFMRNMMGEFGYPQGCVRVFEDNSGCVYTAHGQKDSARTAGYKRTHMYVEGLCSRGVMWLDDVDGKENWADIFTKGACGQLPGVQFAKLRDVIMGINPELHVSRAVMGMMAGAKTEEYAVNKLLLQSRQFMDEL